MWLVGQKMSAPFYINYGIPQWITLYKINRVPNLFQPCLLISWKYLCKCKQKWKGRCNEFFAISYSSVVFTCISCRWRVSTVSSRNSASKRHIHYLQVKMKSGWQSFVQALNTKLPSNMLYSFENQTWNWTGGYKLNMHSCYTPEL
jgi:hypothetical protein